MLRPTQQAYIAGFLDGDGSIYVRLKPNPTYRYGFQVAPYIVLYQSQKSRDEFERICSLIGSGHLRVRSDGILEYIVERAGPLKELLRMVKPFVLLKRKQVNLMTEILDKKERVKSKEDFAALASLIDRFRELNYSKKRKKRVLPP